MKNIKPFIGLVLLLFPLLLSAQEKPRTNYRFYKTIEYMATLKKDKSTFNQLSQVERDMKKTLRFIDYNFFTLPVVFHVLYENEAERVSEEKIYLQLEVLNEAFSNGGYETTTKLIDGKDRRKIRDFRTLREDTRVKFCLPAPVKNVASEIDLGVNVGINYIPTKVEKWEDFFSMKERKTGAAPLITDKYINIWVVDLPDGNSGFAQMPNGPKKYDGIVIDYAYINSIGRPDSSNAESPYHRGHTLTHLMGNYLGLLPLWGEKPCQDDYVSDTPIHNGPNFRCPEVNHISLCNGNPTEMSNNFMDNTFDDCLEIFTAGQMQRIQRVLHPKGPRGKLGNGNIKLLCRDSVPVIIDSLVANERAKPEEIIVEDLPVIDVQHPFKSSLLIRPNPTRDFFRVNLQKASSVVATQYSIQVFNLTGQLVHQVLDVDVQSTLSIQVTDWQPGLYIVKATTGHHSFSQRVVVQ
ncbi:MAG: zinc-dependent metalloprotease [Bacteroidota bacterium]